MDIDSGWKFGGTVEKMMHEINMFGRSGALSLGGFAGSGADWLEQYKPYLDDGRTIIASPHKVYGPESNDLALRRSPKSRSRPLTTHECATLDRLARGMTQKMIAFEFGVSINTVGNLAANAYKKLGVHGAAAAVHAHREAHFLCGTRVDFGPIRERLKASCST